MESFQAYSFASIFCLLSSSPGWAVSTATVSSAEEAELTESAPYQNQNPAFGHNVTATSYTLPEGRASVGNYLLAYGVTDELMIATSPWLAINYNMPMIGLKYSTTYLPFASRISFETAYLKTYDYGLDWYKQESTLNRVTLTYEVNPSYHIHIGGGLQYFWEDRAPFSLRPPSLTETPITLSLAALQEIQITNSIGMFVESGVLGANYPNPYMHLGLSGFFRWSNTFLQIGASTSIPTGKSPTAESNGYWNHPWKNRFGEFHSSVYYSNPIAVHPEIQLQVSL